MSFFRIYQHLLPSGAAWRTTIQKTLRSFFDGLAGGPSDARDYIDARFEDAFPATTSLTALAAWEAQFGIQPNPDEATRRLNLAAEWAAGGGQSPSYIQGVLQTAGFDVYVHEWWSSGPPYVSRDPRDYTTRPLVGTWRCSAFASQPTCSGFATRPRCNRFLNNDPHYLVNKNLTNVAPPPVPNDPARWPYFVYVGDETFPDLANVPASRRSEFERLILKLRPLHNWIVTLIVYVSSDVALTTEDDIDITTEGDVTLVA
jgi:hypothetical protein